MADAEQTESNPNNADGLDASAATVDEQLNEQLDEQAPDLHELGKRVIKLTEKGQAWFLEVYNSSKLRTPPSLNHNITLSDMPTYHLLSLLRA